MKIIDMEVMAQQEIARYLAVEGRSPAIVMDRSDPAHPRVACHECGAVFVALSMAFAYERARRHECKDPWKMVVHHGDPTERE